MSRIGRMPVVIPAGVTVDVKDGNVVTVKGAKGELTRQFAPEMKIAIANILLDEGYIAKYELTGEGVGQMIHVTLKYGKDKNEKIISGIKRISKPGLRVYAGSDEMPKVLGGLGIAIVSTNQGVITDKQARKLHVGGEVLAFVW